jgi:hypothetical protein
MSSAEHAEFRSAEDVVWSFVDQDEEQDEEVMPARFGKLHDMPRGPEQIIGPPRYSDKLRAVGEDVARVVVEKNRAYGDAINKVADVMHTLFPDGITPDKYMDMLLIVRVLDKLSRIADGDPEAFDETPWRDIAGYGICGGAVHYGD